MNKLGNARLGTARVLTLTAAAAWAMLFGSAAAAQSSNASTAVFVTNVASTASGAAASTLSAVAQRAIANSPEVSARVNALLAAGDAIDASRAGFLPRADLEAVTGRTRDVITTRNPEGQSLSHTGLALTATQLLWDGGAVRADVSRLGHERTARWFEFVDSAEQTALEAVRAYHDVLRFRRLVALAEDNYVQHKVVARQMESRQQAGVGRGVDLEQALARLALAESNLATEASNLHDASARFLRIVGEAPSATLAAPYTLEIATLPASAIETVDAAVRSSAAVSAAIEAVRAQRQSVRARSAAFQPKVEARVRAGAGRNFDGVPDQKRDTSAQLALSWNLYNGGADHARMRQQARLLDQSADLRDAACRNVRQTAAIAFNDTVKLAEQLGILERNAMSIARARDAYRQQFDIGQRNLLDLLNAENELYTAGRAVANARIDLSLAQARTLASMQQLNTRLGVARPDAVGGLEPQGWSADDDAPARCPATVISAHSATTRAELDARAAQMVKPVSQPAPAAGPVSVVTSSQPSAEASPEARPKAGKKKRRRTPK
jgi:adhesin transport system outer membrane protein